MEQLRLARHKRFGASSEKNTEAEQLSIFNEAEIYEDAEKAEEKLTVGWKQAIVAQSEALKAMLFTEKTSCLRILPAELQAVRLCSA